MTVIWHNPRCSKSRQTLQLLKDHRIEPTIRLYLTDPPSIEEIQTALNLLGIEPRTLMRRRESIYKTLELAQVEDNDALITAMAAHPILIERPVVLTKDRAALGRPPESVLSLFE